MSIDISPAVARRFVLGKQGLWPGRRWRGLDGVVSALRAVEHLQLDPLQVMARAHDLILHSRVLDYRPDDWLAPTYEARGFFDWGGWLALRPMEEMPHWRVIMRREAGGSYWRGQAAEHTEAIQEMRDILAERGTVANRDFAMPDRKRTDHYRGRKDSALALYYLWRTGEVMTHHRERFERVYALTEAVAPPELIRESDERAAEDFLLRKQVAFYGLAGLRTADPVLRPVPLTELVAWRRDRLDAGDLLSVSVEGWRHPVFALAEDLPLLRDLAEGRVPADWQPLEADTYQEAVFLSPLDVVSARGRAKQLFDFDYIWEVYKPLEQRRWGYYTLPILWGDRLVGRFDGKLDRPANTLRILGFWLEDPATGKDPDFAAALGRGMARYLSFLGAARLDAAAIRPVALRRAVVGACRG